MPDISVKKLNLLNGDVFSENSTSLIDENFTTIQNEMNSRNELTDSQITIINSVSNKQDKSDSNLNTTSKEITGAINELKTEQSNIKGQLDLKADGVDVVSSTTFTTHLNTLNPHQTKISDIKDTNIVNPIDGQVLEYDATTSKWVNKDNSGLVSESASKLATARNISLSGDTTGSTSFDGSQNVTISTTLKDSGVTAGTYSKITVDSKGRVTNGTNLLASDIPSLLLSKISDAGTSASKNVGTSIGNVVIVGSDGKIDSSLIPKNVITEVFKCSNESQMLSLVAEMGDIVIRTDLPSTFILTTNDPTSMSNWEEIKSATSVTSVAGKTGTVILAIDDISGLQAVLDTKISTTDLTNALANYTTTTQLTTLLSGYVQKDGTKVLSDNNYTTAEKNKLAGLTNFSGSYLDLTDKPSIPDVTGLASTTYVDNQVALKAPLTHSHLISDVNGLQSALDSKVAQVADHSLVANSEITKLSNITGNNTGDETQASIKNKLESASTSNDGYLTSVDWNIFNNKQNKILIQNTEPTDKTIDNLWIDTTSIPYKFYRADGTSYNQIGSSESNQILVQATPPTDNTKLWLDNTDINSPILKWHNGTSWIFISGSSSQTQADWNQTDNTKSDYIRNKPPILQNPSQLSEAIKTASKIMLIGDSITLGYNAVGAGSYTTRQIFNNGTNIYYEGNYTVRCWANLFREYCIKINPTIDFINAGISATTMVFANNNKNYRIPYNVDICVINLGVNDFVLNETLTTFSTSYKEFVQYAKTKSKIVICVAPTPALGTYTTQFSLSDCERVISNIAYEEECIFIPLYQMWLSYFDDNIRNINNYLGTDKVHPNDKGHLLIWKMYQQFFNFTDLFDSYSLEGEGTGTNVDLSPFMKILDYDTNADGVVDKAKTIVGADVAPANTIWGKDENGILGWYPKQIITLTPSKVMKFKEYPINQSQFTLVNDKYQYTLIHNLETQNMIVQDDIYSHSFIDDNNILIVVDTPKDIVVKLGYETSEIISQSNADDNIPPPNINNFVGDGTNAQVILSWTNPSDSDFLGVKIMRKTDGYPTSITDGVVIFKGFSSSFTDTNVVNDTTYYYRAFSYDYNKNFNTTDVIELQVTPRIHKIYGFDIDESNIDSTMAVTYTNDAIGFTPLSCNQSTGECDYGSWADVLFVTGNKPCVLNEDGTVAYYLNPNDYTKKIDGSTSTITTNTTNVMSQFNKMYYKFYKTGNILSFRISDRKWDNTWCCNAFISEKDGVSESDYMYISTYNVANNKYSYSGVNPTTSTSITNFRTNITSKGSGWQQFTLSKKSYVQALTILVTKSRNCQTSIGMGNVSTASTLINGTMNTNGQFYGKSNTSSGVKVFHIENLWGNISQWLDGLIIYNGLCKYKTINPYTSVTSYTDGTNYSISTSTTTIGITNMSASNDIGILPSYPLVSASTSTGYPDKFYLGYTEGVYIYPYYGGAYNDGVNSGLFSTEFGGTSIGSTTTIGARLTFS